MKSIKWKMVIPTAIILIILVVALAIYSAINLDRFTNLMVNKQTALTAESLKRQLYTYELNTRMAAEAASKNRTVIEVVASRDREAIQRLLTPYLEMYGIDYFTVTDEAGNVILRTYDPADYGDSVTNQQNVRDAISGIPSTYYEPGTNIALSIRSGGAVVDSEARATVGVISAGKRLDVSESVDELKAMYGAEFTVFMGDTRLVSTITDGNGQRIVGTKMSGEVYSRLMESQEGYTGYADILGERYSAFYLPLKNPQGEVFATVFSGSANRDIITARNIIIMGISIIGSVGLIAAIVFLWVLSGRIIKPLKTLAVEVDEVADGDLNINVPKAARDEVGMLGKSVTRFADILKGLMENINAVIRQRQDGNMDAVLDTEKYKGDYKTLAENINRLMQNSDADLLNLLGILTEFCNGNFDADIPKQPGDKIVINEKVNSMRNHVSGFSDDIVVLAKAATDGKLSERMDASRLDGGWKVLAEELNELLDAIVKPIQEMTGALTKMSQGNLNVEISADYKGDFAVLKDSLNFMSHTVSSYVNEISHVLNEIAEDNLNISIGREYLGDFNSIKSSIMNITDNLNSVIKGIMSSSKQVAHGAKQLADSSTVISQGATEQATSVAALTDMLNSVNKMTNDNAENAGIAAELSEQSLTNAREGDAEMDKMLAAMDEIRNSSAGIAKIIKVIDEIAFQTNILAINAAVEAARAGDHGRGFMVVAEEVRSLAAKSQEAAQNSSSLIEESIRNVNEGSGIANATAESLKKIVDNVSEVTSSITKIAAISKEQEAAVGQITNGITEISGVIQENSASAQESAATSEELASQSDVLDGMVGVFKLR